MSHSRSPRRLRLTVAAVGALVVGPLSVTPATAQDATGDTVVGQLVRAYVEPRPRQGGEAPATHEVPAEPLTWIEPEVGAAVRVPSDEVPDVPVGSTVEVEVGGEVVDEAATENGVEPAREVLAAEVVAPAPPKPVAPAATLPYTNEVTVVMVRPPGATSDGTTVTQVVDAVNGPVADFWQQESNGRVRVGVTHMWDWRDSTAGCDRPTQLWDEIAAATGFVDAPGKHLLLYIPGQAGTLPDCADGLAEVGSAPGDGGRLYVRDVLTSLIAHELGHNFSLGHSGSLSCVGALDHGDCEFDEYGDLYDVMGGSWDEVGSLSAPHAHQLGFLPADQTFSFTAAGRGGRVTLWPVAGRSGMRAVRLVDSLGNAYWVESRRATGQDSWLSEPGRNYFALQEGLVVRSAEVMPDLSLMLDASPPSSLPNDWRVAVARPISVAGGEFTISSEWLNGQWVLRVTTGSGAAFPRDWSGENRADLFAVDRGGALLLYLGDGSGGFAPRRAIGSGWQNRDLITSVGDWDSDGKRDMVARDPRNGDLWLYRGNGAGGFAGWRVIGRGWHTMDALFSPGDWNGDGHTDLMARARSGTYAGHLLFYPGDGRGGFAPRPTTPWSIGRGWGVMRHVAAADDWDGNGVQDLVAIDRWTGDLYLYRGDGEGGFDGRTVIGRGWHIFSALVGPGDWNGDGAADLLARRTDGGLLLYPGTGSGGFLPARQIGAGWSTLRLGS